MFILGSSSPRRKEILSFFSIPFEQASPDFDEASISPKDYTPADFAAKLSQEKGLSLLKKYPNKPILTADTVVACNGQIFGQRGRHFY